LAAIRALDQKVGLSWKCGTEVAHQTREVAGRAPASSQRISMAGIVHPPAPDEDEEHPGGVIMRNMPGRAGSDAKAKASSCIASDEAAFDGQFPWPTGSAWTVGPPRFTWRRIRSPSCCHLDNRVASRPRVGWWPMRHGDGLPCALDQS
jgi:hypothetical protein